jgi:hypothetical protein
MSIVPLDLSPLMLTAIGLVVYGVGHRWVDRRRRAPSRRAGSGAKGTPTPPPPTQAVDDNPEPHARPWWRDPVGAAPILIGLAMIVGSTLVERAFGTVVSIAASLFLPGR